MESKMDDFVIERVSLPDFIIHNELRALDQTQNQADQDFAINEVRNLQPSRKEMPQPGQYIVVGEFNVTSVPVFIHEEALLAMKRHLESNVTSPVWGELGGATTTGNSRLVSLSSSRV